MQMRYRGLSLIELNVAIVIAALVMFAAFQIIASGMRLQSQSRINARLAALAQKAIEQKRLEVFQTGSANQPLPVTPSGRQTFTAPDGEFGYEVTYYNYETYSFPPDIKIWFIPLSWPDPDKKMYLIAMKVVVDGPVVPGGGRRADYRKVEVVTLMHYPVYQNSSPPTSNTMHCLPPPSPLIPIGMP
ncbi:MAG: PilW family protein [Candidatus Xenobiia bacterium LiM19]